MKPIVLSLFCLLSVSYGQTILIVGDSIAETRSSGSRGWGSYLSQHFQPTVSVTNRAQSGRSSKSFIDAGLWSTAKELTSDYVFIEFGHNDQAAGSRFTDPDTTYPGYLSQYASDVLSWGGTPVFITPPNRNYWSDSATMIQGTVNNTTLDDYSNAMRVLAQTNGYSLIDLDRLWEDEMENLGQAQAAAYYYDDNHFTILGAERAAEFIAGAIPTSVPSLALNLAPLKAVDALQQAIVGGNNDHTFDVDGDGTVTPADLSAFVTVEIGAVIGDLDLTGEVNSSDLGLLLNGFGATTGVLYSNGDINANGLVDSMDLGLLLNSFGQSAAVIAVPEPSSPGLMFFAAALLLGIRPRRLLTSVGHSNGT